ncbi:hypothetical protein RRG08_002100 [Elysia crispata]|uniref:Uncharacterized protein n=1 Tax=Elysia crispata TaxID=231223 RepID=A0AAE0ZKX8_9GAST|nr:hypothetical protein RRG08_002100 [Elysia crispata]
MLKTINSGTLSQACGWQCQDSDLEISATRLSPSLLYSPLGKEPCAVDLSTPRGRWLGKNCVLILARKGHDIVLRFQLSKFERCCTSSLHGSKPLKVYHAFDEFGGQTDDHKPSIISPI